MTTAAPLQVPPPLRRSLQRTKSLGRGIGVCPGSPEGSLGTAATERSSSGGFSLSSDDEGCFFKILSEADDEKKSGNDSAGSGLSKKSHLWNSVPNLDFDPFEESPVSKKPTFKSNFFGQYDFSDNIVDPVKLGEAVKLGEPVKIVEPVRIKTEKVTVQPVIQQQAPAVSANQRPSQSASTSQVHMVPKRQTSLDSGTAKERRKTPQRSRSFEDLPLGVSPDARSASSTPGGSTGTKKKRIMVRASDFGDKQQVEDAFRRWKSEQGGDGSGGGGDNANNGEAGGSGTSSSDLVAIQRSLRSSSSHEILPDGSGSHIRVKVRRSMSNDEMGMPASTAETRSLAAARVNTRGSSASSLRRGSLRSRSKSRSRQEGSNETALGVVGGEKQQVEADQQQSRQPSQQPRQVIQRSRSIGRRRSNDGNGINRMGDGGGDPSSLGGHFQAQSHTDAPQVGRSCQSVGGAPSTKHLRSRSLGAHLRDSSSQETIPGGPPSSARSVVSRKSRIDDDGSRSSVRGSSLINRRIRNRSLVRQPSGGLTGILASRVQQSIYSATPSTTSSNLESTGSSHSRSSSCSSRKGPSSSSDPVKPPEVSLSTKSDKPSDTKENINATKRSSDDCSAVTATNKTASSSPSPPSEAATATATTTLPAAAPAPAPATSAQELELLRLMQQTGITVEQLLKLREAGFSLNTKAE